MSFRRHPSISSSISEDSEDIIEESKSLCNISLDFSSPRNKKIISDCNYKTHIAGIGGAKPCNFNIESLPNGIEEAINSCIGTNNIKFVIIPVGTIMYRGYLIYPGMSKNLLPWVRSKNFGWFTSTLEHQGNINHTHIQKFKTNKPLLCIFQHRLHSTGMRGNQYYKYVKQYSDKLSYRDSSLMIDGYIGCDECEIGLTKESIQTKLLQGPLEQVKSLKYID